MAEEFADIIVEGKLDIPYRYYAGPVATRFYDALEGERKILGLRCPACRKVFVPPRGTCGACFREMDQWEEVGPGGELLNYTVVHYTEPIQPMPAPLVYGIIRLDGADTGLVHMLGELDPAAVRIGMRVTAVFASEPQGNILDIRYFKPASSAAP